MKFNRQLFKEAYKKGYKRARLDEAATMNKETAEFVASKMEENLLWELAEKLGHTSPRNTNEANLSAIVHRLSEDLMLTIERALTEATEYTIEDIEEAIYGAESANGDDELEEKAYDVLNAAFDETAREKLVVGTFKKIVKNLGVDKV